jgi:hypothetical protein
MIWLKPLLHTLVNIEPWLNMIALVAVIKSGVWRRFPAMTAYLGLRSFTDGALLLILNEQHFFAVSAQTQTLTYIYSYWALYILGAVAIFFALQEIFTAVMEPVPGLQSLGLLVFRWASIAAVIILLGTSIPVYRSGSSDLFFESLTMQMMRCVSILEICLLAYLALSVHSLGRSFRGRVFGIGLGFGLEAAGELIFSALPTRPGPLWSWTNLLLESASIIAVLVWTTYFLLPEPAEERHPITLPVTSPLVRWNDVAAALGQQRPAHVALGAEASAFFLQDVEKTVDKFLTKTS